MDGWAQRPLRRAEDFAVGRTGGDHRLRTLQQAALRGAAHLHSRLPGLHDGHADGPVPLPIRVGELSPHLGGGRGRRCDGQRQRHPVQLEKPDQGPDHGGGSLVLRAGRDGAGRRALHGGVDLLPGPVLQPGPVSAHRAVHEGQLEPFRDPSGAEEQGQPAVLRHDGPEPGDPN